MDYVENSSSLFGQDKWLDELLNGFEQGVFVDVGAHDGITANNTEFFETVRDWTGLLVEPNPHVMASLDMHRPNVEHVQLAAWDEDGLAMPFLAVAGSGSRLSCCVPNGLSPQLVETLSKWDCRASRETVRTVRLSTLLRHKRINNVDYLAIDVEGAEMNVLRGIDWDSVNIDVISVRTTSESATRKVNELLCMELGFTEIKQLGEDRFYRRTA